MLINEMLDNIEVVIFDLDGTLIDSMKTWVKIDIEYLAKFNKRVPEDLNESIEGMGFRETAEYFKERFDIPDSIEQIELDWNKAAYSKYAKEILLKDGVKSFIKKIKERNIKLAVATSNSRELTEVCLKRLQVFEDFDVIKTADEVKAGKNSPDIFIDVANALGVECEKCLVFEDIVTGLQAGIDANMKVCAVYDDFSKDTDDEKRKIADYYIYSYHEIV